MPSSMCCRRGFAPPQDWADRRRASGGPATRRCPAFHPPGRCVVTATSADHGDDGVADGSRPSPASARPNASASTTDRRTARQGTPALTVPAATPARKQLGKPDVSASGVPGANPPPPRRGRRRAPRAMPRLRAALVTIVWLSDHRRREVPSPDRWARITDGVALLGGGLVRSGSRRDRARPRRRRGRQRRVRHVGRSR